MSNVINYTADVLEKVAAYLDSIEAESQQKYIAQQRQVAEALKPKLASILGPDVDENLVQKLSATDPDIVSLFNKVAETINVESLGGPGNNRDSTPQQLTKEESTKLASDKFTAWLLA